MDVVTLVARVHLEIRQRFRCFGRLSFLILDNLMMSLMSRLNLMRGRRFQEIAIILRNHIRERHINNGDHYWVGDVTREIRHLSAQIVQLTAELNGEIAHVGYIDITNQELVEQVA